MDQEKKSLLNEAKRQYKALQKKFIKRLHVAHEVITGNECRDLVLDILNEKLAGHLDSYVNAHRQVVIVDIENWWDKYRVTLRDIEAKRKYISRTLSNLLEEIGYSNG